MVMADRSGQRRDVTNGAREQHKGKSNESAAVAKDDVGSERPELIFLIWIIGGINHRASQNCAAVTLLDDHVRHCVHDLASGDAGAASEKTEDCLRWCSGSKGPADGGDRILGGIIHEYAAVAA